MFKLEIPTERNGLKSIQSQLETRLTALDPHAIVRVQLTGPKADALEQKFTARTLRDLAPATMNVSMGYRWARKEGGEIYFQHRKY